MPRVADHDERRANIAHAFQRLVVAGGPATATFARIAHEAEVSVGAIQHYFPDRVAVLRFSYEHGAEEMLQRIEAQVAEHERRHETIASMTLAGLRQLLPLDEVRRQEAAVHRSLLSEAPHDDALAQVARAVSSRLRRRIATGIANAKTCGEVAAEVDEAAAAVRLLAVAHGLGLEISVSGESTHDVDAVLQPVLDTVFTGRCRRHD